MKLDESWMKPSMISFIELEHRRFNSIDKEENPCEVEPTYDFKKCVDTAFSRK